NNDFLEGSIPSSTIHIHILDFNGRLILSHTRQGGKIQQVGRLVSSKSMIIEFDCTFTWILGDLCFGGEIN
ncbi:hypothetical protein LINGRAHAP2_LOCUS25367, partial [Linum grandiflorum]